MAYVQPQKVYTTYPSPAFVAGTPGTANYVYSPYPNMQYPSMQPQIMQPMYSYYPAGFVQQRSSIIKDCCMCLLCIGACTFCCNECCGVDDYNDDCGC